MKCLTLSVLLVTAMAVQSVHARVVDIDVHGMTCAFCVDSLERAFDKMDSVSKVEVSLKHKKIHLETDNTQPSIAVIKQTVLDAGFTPTKISVQSNEN